MFEILLVSLIDYYSLKSNQAIIKLKCKYFLFNKNFTPLKRFEFKVTECEFVIPRGDIN